VKNSGTGVPPVQASYFQPDCTGKMPVQQGGNFSYKIKLLAWLASQKAFAPERTTKFVYCGQECPLSGNCIFLKKILSPQSFQNKAKTNSGTEKFSTAMFILQKRLSQLLK